MSRARMQDIKDYLSVFAIQNTTSIRKITAGRIAHNYVVRTVQGDYILRLYDINKGQKLLYTAKRFIFEAESLKFLQQYREVSVPVPLAVPHNPLQNYWQTDTCVVMVYPYIQGTPLTQGELCLQTAQRAAKYLKSLIRITQTFSTKDRPIATMPDGDIAHIARITNTLDQQFFTHKTLAKMHHYINHYPHKELLHLSPKGLVHGDFFFENTLWTDTKEICAIIDFGDCFYGAVLNDIAIGAMEFSVQNNRVCNPDFYCGFIENFHDWFVKNKIMYALFKSVVLANCIRYSTHLIRLGIEQGISPEQCVNADYNPYINRFDTFLMTDILECGRCYFP